MFQVAVVAANTSLSVFIRDYSDSDVGMYWIGQTMETLHVVEFISYDTVFAVRAALEPKKPLPVRALKYTSNFN